MKTNTIIPVSFAAFLCFSCQKDHEMASAAAASNAVQASMAISTCDAFTYADTIFYPAELPNDYIVHTLNPLSGSFGSYPDGLRMNPLNGDIDITESETGLRYLIWYVPAGTTDTCKKFITVSGINFTDSIYVLQNNLPIAMPVYNATPGAQVACTGSCEFDDGPDDDDGDGFADEPLPGQEVIPQGVALDKATGKINLKRTMRNGALGVDPANGTFKDFQLNYRISDGSKKTLNKIGFRLYYFRHRSQIPKSLLKELRAKQSLVLLNDGQQASNFSAFTTSTTSFSGSNLIMSAKANEVKCRPPYLIVVKN